MKLILKLKTTLLNKMVFRFLILNAFLLHINSQTFCFWPNTNDLTTNTAFLGEYELSSETYNGKPVYVNKDGIPNCAYTTSYIAYKWNRWNVMDDFVNEYYYMYCTENTQANPFSVCDYKWEVSGMTGNRQIKFTEGECPQFACESIKIVSSTTCGCCNRVMNKIDTNTYSANGYYLHYNVMRSKWICGYVFTCYVSTHLFLI